MTDANTQVLIPNGSVWGQAIRNMTTYTAPAATAQLHVPVPAGWDVGDACARIRQIVIATPKVLATPEPSVLLDRGGTDNAMQIVVTFAPEGDPASLVKNEILRAIDDQMENPARRQRIA